MSFSLAPEPQSEGYNTNAVSFSSRTTPSIGYSDSQRVLVDSSKTILENMRFVSLSSEWTTGTLVGIETTSSGDIKLAKVNSTVEDVIWSSTVGVSDQNVVYTNIAVEGIPTTNIPRYDSTYPIEKAFDNDKVSHFHSANGSTSGWIRYDLASPQVVDAFSFYADGDSSHLPRTFTFEGSQDGENWTELGSWTNVPTPVSGVKSVYAISNTTAYQSYRWNIVNTLSSYLVLWSVELLQETTRAGSCLIKTYNESTQWNAGASSLQKISSTQCGYVEATVISITDSIMFGLNSVNTASNYTDIDYAIYLAADGYIHIYENGVHTVSQRCKYYVGDKIRVTAEGSEVKYYLNEELLYVSTIAPTYPLYGDVSLLTYNSKLDHCKFSTYTYETSGSYLSPILDISQEGVSKDAFLDVVSEVPTNSSISLEFNISYDNGTTWSGWQGLGSILNVKTLTATQFNVPVVGSSDNTGFQIRINLDSQQLTTPRISEFKLSLFSIYTSPKGTEQYLANFDAQLDTQPEIALRTSHKQDDFKKIDSVLRYGYTTIRKPKVINFKKG